MLLLKVEKQISEVHELDRAKCSKNGCENKEVIANGALTLRGSNEQRWNYQMKTEIDIFRRRTK